MNNFPVIEAELIHPPMDSSDPGIHRGLAVWQRLLIALGMLVVMAGAGCGVWIFGILMFTFSLEWSQQQPASRLAGCIHADWVADFQIGLVALVPATLMALGAKWKWIVGSLIGTGLTSTAVFMVGVIAVFRSLA